jgi:hypothetical protein
MRIHCSFELFSSVKRLREWELTSLEFRSSEGTAVWPEEELEDIVCDVACAVVRQYWGCVI